MVDPRDLGLVEPDPFAASRGARRSTCTRRSPVASACPSGCGNATTSCWRGPPTLICGLRVRRRLPGLHRAPPRAARQRQGARPAAPRRPRGERRRRTIGGPGRRLRPGMIDGGTTARPPARAVSRRDACGHRGGAWRRRRSSPGPARRAARRRDGRRGPVEPRKGTIVRCEVPSRSIPLDRDRLATLPGQPPPGVPLVCLDTETTGLATAAGTVAWLIGLGWWERRPVPPGPAPAPRSRRGTSAADRAGRPPSPRTRGW